MHYLLWLPSFVLGTAVSTVAPAADHSSSWTVFAAVLGGLAAVISALTGLYVAINRRDAQIVIIAPEEAEALGVTKLPQKKRRQR